MGNLEDSQAQQKYQVRLANAEFIFFCIKKQQYVINLKCTDFLHGTLMIHTAQTYLFINTFPQLQGGAFYGRVLHQEHSGSQIVQEDQGGDEGDTEEDERDLRARTATQKQGTQ